MRAHHLDPCPTTAVILPRPDSWIRLSDHGWPIELGEHAEFGTHVVAWAGQGFVNSRFFTERVTAAEAEAFAACLLVACNIAGIPDRAATDSAAAVTIPLPGADPHDPAVHEPGYTYFGAVGCRAGQPFLLVDGEFLAVTQAWFDALNLLAASRIARIGRAA
uniref:hypothetical protein n=1 Tax=Nocardia suismassiliense TaxID=2077092 RepID=UPI003F498C6B